MNRIGKKRAAPLAAKLSAVTLALAAMAPLPAALAPLSGVTIAHAQSNPCAPSRPATKSNNPCAPKKARPSNPCAPRQAAKPKKADKNCRGPKNPCAPARKCS
ncbi:MAG: hypothetical protein EPN74_14415 [Rhodanobacter sp.]|nr:MAG: hypothetical protein EPN74_14415 [Rhodanobacter sp.]